jgi:hypothetical protein
MKFPRHASAAAAAGLLSLCLTQPARAAERPDSVAARIAALKAARTSFPAFDLLRAQGTADLEGATPLGIDRRVLASLRRLEPETLTVTLPNPAGGLAALELERVDLYAPGFIVVSSESDGEAVPVQRGLHYRGVVRGEAGSLAALSVTPTEILGFYRTPAGGMVSFGKPAGSAAHRIKPDRAQDQPASLSCQTEYQPWESGDFPEDAGDAREIEPKAAPPQCIRVYFEANTDMFQNKGSVQAVVDYVTGAFNQSNVIFTNESMPVRISQIFVWTTASPYTAPSFGMLSQFQSFRNTFNGDLGALLTFKFVGGVAASISGVCNNNIDSRQMVGGIQTSFAAYPTFNHTVNVITHELGHLLGSPHTHNCSWNGNNTAIDGCAAVEGSCPRPGLPPGGGTIMSYCPNTAVGTNFQNGFGPQPGNRIRARYAAATCLQNCGDANPGVVFFQHSSFGGTSTQPLARGNYTLSQLQSRGFVNDWASSVRVPAGFRVVMFQHNNFTGTSWTVTADTPSFRNLVPSANDQVSSVRVE